MIPELFLTNQFESLFDATFSDPINANLNSYKETMTLDQQIELLNALECYCKKSSPFETLSQIPFVLKRYYDEDILLEENILEWSEHCDSVVGKYADPFIEWLKTADEESE